MYVTPFSTKTQVSPATNGELRASILTVEDDTLGVINVGDSISSITSELNYKQTKITDNSYLSISDGSGLSDELLKVNLDEDRDIIVDTITCGNITANLGATIRATTLIATDNLYYGPIQNLVSVEGKIGEMETNIGLNTITNTTDIDRNDITCNGLTSNTLNVGGVFNMADMIKTDSLETARNQLNALVIRRPTGASNGKDVFEITLKEIQVWVNNINILQRLDSFNVTTITSMFALWSDKTVDMGSLSGFPSSRVYSDEEITGDFQAHSGETTNANIAWIIRGIPPYYLDEIQSIVLYNRTARNGGYNSKGLAIELYNSLSDPDLTTVLATTIVIIETKEAYWFDGPSINTYTLGLSNINSTTNITTNAYMENPINIYETFNTVNIGSNFRNWWNVRNKWCLC